MTLQTVYIIHEMGTAYRIEDGYLLCTPLLTTKHGTEIHLENEDWSEIAWGCIDEDDERELLTLFVPLGLDMKTVGGCPTKEGGIITVQPGTSLYLDVVSGEFSVEKDEEE